ncbi:HD domain-containing protein [Halalkalibacterium halodurans]|uniref:BH2866 protein n=1 Tax=Halalkalibacterium halodurans (strain ATCC BAA-125 / DSM 18197 / FERM 7344 / JCM 9153 / C-125) TaxID=272558 RepID=Q9K8Y6_HALH5|nr:HD domain-containing protein [Halalkalibacterium halodurans]MED4081654.1 HD domain-containing protein [Halalkalibacterium halodurans]MED4085207.1 HD domain-containing protein [Halalkalibacterium halodurans]MED4104179.1 HD domain-containing protein [Halalkalibacterium halodurans]MED4110503.1 HD domain-containing protein [Halalkalibacterium halodurans]MED4125307.1 HD domain-containing protein [Halalkalibacterium halodurans]
MHRVTFVELFNHHITQKYVKRSGMAHAIACAYHALQLAKQYGVDPDLATKAAFLHDIGHYTWYRNGSWDYDLYKENDIHAIKGAERAHKLLIRLGEHPKKAKEIALAILLHTDSYLPDGKLELSPLQKVVALADEADEEPKGRHHYRTISDEKALEALHRLDQLIVKALQEHDLYQKTV